VSLIVSLIIRELFFFVIQNFKEPVFWNTGKKTDKFRVCGGDGEIKRN
jgi:hypothetical protein